MRRAGRSGAWERWVSRALVAVFLLGVGRWEWRAGLDVRQRAWAFSRSIRFNNDISHAVLWGNRVLRTAEALADGTPVPEATDMGAPAGHRRLSVAEIMRGEGRLYDDLLNGQPGGDFELDYPPLRLLTMSLWVRAVQDRMPNLTSWPGERSRANGLGGDGGPASEDVAGPLLWINTVAAAVTAVLSFALVWLWVDRGGRPPAPEPVAAGGRRRRRPPPVPRTPLRRANGLVLFPVAFLAFAYAVSVAVLPLPAPAPAVAVVEPPLVHAGADPEQVTAEVRGSVDPQGADARCHAEWGLAAGVYDHATPDQDAGGGSGAHPISIGLTDLPAGRTVHYRLVARNDDAGGGGPGGSGTGRGTTRSDDAMLIATAGVIQPAPPSGSNGESWFGLGQWLGLALLFALTCAGMRVLPPEHHQPRAGLVAATFVWFDPALLVDTHVWPQWDAWVLPPFLLAALLASLDWWLAAGLVLGAGGMFKGQLLLGSPVLILWPLLSLRWGAVGRLLAGFALMAGLVVSPWLVLNGQPPSWSSEPLRWVVGVGIAAAIGATLSLCRRPVLRAAGRLWRDSWAAWRDRRTAPADPAPDPQRPPHGDAPASPFVAPSVSLVGVGLFAAALLVAIVADTLLVVRRWPPDADLPRRWAAYLLLAVLVLPWLLRRRSLGMWAAAVMAVAIWGSAWLYHGDWSWKAVGFDYGARKFDDLAMSQGKGNNLGTLLQDGFGWNTHDVMFRFHLPDLAGLLYAGRPAAPGWLHDLSLDGSMVTLDVRESMLALYGVGVLVAGVGAAVQDRRNDPRFLAAMVAPWLLMPNLLAQMKNRYELWGAVLSSMLVAISSGLGLLHVVVSLLAAAMIANQLLNYDPSRSPMVQQVITGLGSASAGVLLAAAAAVLFVAVVPGRRVGRRRRRQGSGRSRKSYGMSSSVAVTGPDTTSLAGLAASPLDMT
jgi:hypothetical protein